MPSRTSSGLRRASATLLAGAFLAAGCGSASGQGTRTSIAVRAASTGTTAGYQPAGSRSGRSADSGIVGQTVGLVCGGPSSDQGCPRRPVVATIDILRLPSQRHIATVRTDNRGHFRRNLPAGTYKLQARASGQLVRARAVTVRILTHQIKHTTITFVPRHPLPAAPRSASG
jgi:hypothetical protein